jgi:hypothetical protein
MVLGVRLRFGFAMPPFCEMCGATGTNVDWPQAGAFPGPYRPARARTFLKSFAVTEISKPAFPIKVEFRCSSA